MSARPRPLVRLSFKEVSPLADGRLPTNRQQKNGDIVVELDPVSLAALLTSVGKHCTVEQAAYEIPGMACSTNKDQKGDTRISGEGI